MGLATSLNSLRIPSVLRFTVFALLLLTDLARAADQPFDVIVTADSTPVMAGEKPIGEVRKGTRLTVARRTPIGI